MARTILKGGQGTGRGLLLLMLLFGVIAAALIFLALNKDDEGKEVSAADTVEVVVAGQDINPREELEEGMLDVVEVPSESAISGSYSEVEPLVGQTARYPILKGEQVTATKLGFSEDIEELGVSSVLPAGMRAFSISVSEDSSVGGLILPGDLVDIIAILEQGDVGLDKAVTLIQNVEVLAVAQEAQEPIPPAASTTATPEPTPGTLGERPEDVEPNPGARTVTLAVTPEQAQLLALVQARGELALSLRSPGDRDTTDLPQSDLVPYGAVPKTPSQ